MAEFGEDSEDVDERVTADNKRADENGLVYDSDPRKTSLMGLERKTDAVPGDTSGDTLAQKN